jgi:hypothetical protein
MNCSSFYQLNQRPSPVGQSHLASETFWHSNRQAFPEFDWNRSSFPGTVVRGSANRLRSVVKFALQISASLRLAWTILPHEHFRR